MQTALEHLSKEDLLKVISSRDQALFEQQRMVDSLQHDSSQKDEKIASLSKERDTLSQERDHLKAQVEMLRRMQFGQKRERFEADPN